MDCVEAILEQQENYFSTVDYFKSLFDSLIELESIFKSTQGVKGLINKYLLMCSRKK